MSDMNLYKSTEPDPYGEYYDFLGDVDELRWFYDYAVPKVERDLVLFWSLSARNKLLSGSERDHFKLGRSEMIHKTVLRKNGFSFFLESLRSSECHKGAMLTKARIPYPRKCLRLYWNLNPTSVRKVMFEQQRKIHDYNEEMMNAALKGSKDAVDSAFHKMRRIFDATLSLYARSSVERMWMDFEIDVGATWLSVVRAEQVFKDFVDAIRHELTRLVGRGNFMVVTSPGGFHFPVKRKAVKFNPEEIVSAVKRVATEREVPLIGDEVARNDNEMLILPGTIAYDSSGAWTIPEVVNKEDFCGADKIEKPEDVIQR